MPLIVEICTPVATYQFSYFFYRNTVVYASGMFVQIVSCSPVKMLQDQLPLLQDQLPVLQDQLPLLQN